MQTWDTTNPDDTYVFLNRDEARVHWPLLTPPPPRRRRWPRLRALLARNPGRHQRRAARP